MARPQVSFHISDLISHLGEACSVTLSVTLVHRVAILLEGREGLIVRLLSSVADLNLVMIG